MARSLNRVQLIGNLTRDPELRYTPNGTAVCTIGLATNRSWTTDTGEKHEESEFHKIVAWNKLAELCSQFLTKGRKIYVEGRLATRKWNAQDGTPRTSVEVVIDDMILLDSNRRGSEEAPRVSEGPMKDEDSAEVQVSHAVKTKPQKVAESQDVTPPAKKEEKEEEEPMVTPEDIPF